MNAREPPKQTSPKSKKSPVLPAVLGRWFRPSVRPGAFVPASATEESAALALPTGAGAEDPIDATSAYLTAFTPCPTFSGVIRSGDKSQSVTTFISSADRLDGSLSYAGSTASTGSVLSSVILTAYSFG